MGAGRYLSETLKPQVGNYYHNETFKLTEKHDDTLDRSKSYMYTWSLWQKRECPSAEHEWPSSRMLRRRSVQPRLFLGRFSGCAGLACTPAKMQTNV